MIIKAEKHHIQEVSNLYDVLNDYLAATINYPGWTKHVYPSIDTAREAIENETLYINLWNDKITGTIILNHEPEQGYQQANWNCDFPYEKIIVIHTLAIHPEYLNKGIASKLIDYAIEESKKNDMKALRLDVTDKNLPAIHLYEKHGFQYIDTIDLGYGEYGIDFFKLYQMIL